MSFRSSALAIVFCAIALTPGTGLAQVCDHPFARPPSPARSALCALGERVEDAYAPGRFFLCEEMEVDHIVSLRQAWASGVCNDDLRRFAADRDNLRLTHWRTNRQKGALPPEEFAGRLPAEVAGRVLRDAAVIERRYGIRPLDAALHARMRATAVRLARFERLSAARPPPPRCARPVHG